MVVWGKLIQLIFVCGWLFSYCIFNKMIYLFFFFVFRKRKWNRICGLPKPEPRLQCTITQIGIQAHSILIVTVTPVGPHLRLGLWARIFSYYYSMAFEVTRTIRHRYEIIITTNRKLNFELIRITEWTKIKYNPYWNSIFFFIRRHFLPLFRV